MAEFEEAGEDEDDVEVEFLTFQDVCDIHDRALELFGYGLAGFLDEHAARSAAAQPEAALAGQYLFSFPSGMAAAYLYYLTNQQGFLNGNKRTAVGATIEFLARNGYRLTTTAFELYQVTVSLAGEDVVTDRETALAELTRWIEIHLAPMP